MPDYHRTLHIDLILELATQEELSTLTRQWERGSVRTRIQTRLAQISGELDQIQGEIKLLKDVLLPTEKYKASGWQVQPPHKPQKG